MKILKKIIAINLFIFISVALASDHPASYSECVLKYVSGDTFPEVAKIIESACKDQFPSEKKVLLEDAKCADEKALLQSHDAYIAQNFNDKVLAAKRSKAVLGGLMSGGTGTTAGAAGAKFDREIELQKNQNREQRIQIVAMIARCSAR